MNVMSWYSELIIPNHEIIDIREKNTEINLKLNFIKDSIINI
jgi:hypothetical protein